MLYSIPRNVVPVVNNTGYNTLAVLYGHHYDIELATIKAGFYITKITISDNVDPSNKTLVFVSLVGDDNCGMNVFTIEGANVPTYSNTTTLTDDDLFYAFQLHTFIPKKDIKHLTFIKEGNDIWSVTDNEKDTIEFVSSIKKTKFLWYAKYYGFDLLGYNIPFMPKEFFTEVKDYSIQGIRYYLVEWNRDYQISFHRQDNGTYLPRLTRWYPDGINGWVCNSCYGVIVAPKYEAHKLYTRLFNSSDEEIEEVLNMDSKTLQNWKNKVLAR